MTKALKPAKITFRNILAVLQAFWRRFRFSKGGFAIPRHIYEQIIWRRTKVIENSPECWESGNCVWCGCEILGKTMEDRACENENLSCYPPMMNKETWKKYKKFHNIKLFE